MEDKKTELEVKATAILDSYGYHEGNVIDYSVAMSMIMDALAQELL